MENIENVVEAIIFSSGSPILKSDLCDKIPELTTQKLNGIVKTLQKRYSGDSGVLLIEFNGKLQFTSNPKYGETVTEVLTPLKEKELTRTLLEVLSTIAYKQPITRLEIDDMRGGTNSEYAISGLLKAGLIQAVGRKDTVGRPVLYGTTDEFLKKFQLTEVGELPDYTEVLEQLQILSGPSQETLFHNRTISDFEDEEGESPFVAEGADTEGLVAADTVDKSAIRSGVTNEQTAVEDDDDFFFNDDDDLPDFLMDEDDIDTYE